MRNKEEFWGVLVSVSIVDSEGAIFDDLGYLFDKDKMYDYDEAIRCYHSINLTDAQERALWLYLRRFVTDNNGLVLTYELIDEDGHIDLLEIHPLG